MKKKITFKIHFFLGNYFAIFEKKKERTIQSNQNLEIHCAVQLSTCINILLIHQSIASRPMRISVKKRTLSHYGQMDFLPNPLQMVWKRFILGPSYMSYPFTTNVKSYLKAIIRLLLHVISFSRNFVAYMYRKSRT